MPETLWFEPRMIEQRDLAKMSSFVLLALLLQTTNVFAGPCIDGHRFCPHWANMGACQANREYMARHCAKSCGCERINPPSDETTTTETTAQTTATTVTTTIAVTSKASTSESSGTTDDSEETTATVTEAAPKTEASTSPSVLPSTTEVVSTRPPSPAPTCSQYQRKENTDLAGVMLDKVRAWSFDACCSKCDATDGCDGFSFYRRMCYLKANLQGTFPKASRTTFIRKQPVRPGQCSAFAETQANSDLAGILVKPPLFAVEQEDCCHACATVPECEGFSYYRNFCYLKGKLQGTYPKSGCKVQVKSSARRLLGDEHSPGLWV